MRQQIDFAAASDGLTAGCVCASGIDTWVRKASEQRDVGGHSICRVWLR